MTRVCGRVNKLICRMKAPPDTMGCHDRKPPPKYARPLGATVALQGTAAYAHPIHSSGVEE
jgi:hypothetical protein